MSKKSRTKKQPAPPPRRLPWLWLVAGGTVLLIVGGLAAMWGWPGTGPAVTPVVSGSPRLDVDRTEVDEGYIKLGRTIRTTFTLANVGDQPLKILETPQVELVEGC